MKSNNEDALSVSGLIFVLIPIVGLIFGFVVVIPAFENTQKDLCPSIKEIIHSDTLIYSTQDGTATEGRFFLGSGHINTYLVYFVYIGDDVNGFKREMIRADNVVIFRDSAVPHMIKKTVYKMTVLDVLLQTKGCLPNDVIELHVPKNTLIKDV